MTDSELDHECASCARVRDAHVAEPARFSRRKVLQLGATVAAAGFGAAALRMTPAFAGTPGPIEHETPPPGAVLPQPALPPNVNAPAPPIITRAQWGANEALRKPGQSYNSVVEK